MEMSELGLLSAGLSAILRREVVLKDGEAKLSIHDVLKKTYVMKPPGFSRPSRNRSHETPFEIYVEILRGFVSYYDDFLTLQVTERSSVFGMKLLIQEEVLLELEQFDLIFDNELLVDDRTVKDYGLQPGCTIYLVLRLDGGGGPLTVSKDELDSYFDCDFTRVNDDGKRYMRGGFEYQRPYGWKRFGIRALGRFENDDWLGPDGIRTSQASGEWPVSYHGTNKECAEKIVKEGYKPGPRAKFGKGIYTSPSLEMVETYYAQEFSYKWKSYKIALQNRVNPDHLKIISSSETGVGAEYWLSSKGDDVRPYGFLIRKIRQTESDFSLISTPQQPMSQRGLQTRSVSLNSVYQSAQPSQNTQACCRCSLM